MSLDTSSSQDPRLRGLQDPARAEAADSLARALLQEASLLTRMAETLQNQREAVAAEDLAGVDDTIFSGQRILRTLAEARLRRRTLLHVLVGDPEHHLCDLPETLGPRTTPSLDQALPAIEAAAQELAKELRVNREILSSAMRSGEDLIRVMGGAEGQDAGVYSPGADSESRKRDHGMIIDRQV